jgi:hypothetical protein
LIRSFGAISLAATVLAASLASASAQTDGRDKFHAQARVGNKVCMTEHEHYGEGELPSRRGAEAAAKRAWSSFTAWEYGQAWGNYALAAGKKMSCTQSGGRWLCKTTARPCRPAR